MDSDLKRIVEALLFAAPEPLSVERMRSIIPYGDKRTIRAALAELAAEYDERGHAFQLVEIGGGWRVTTRPEYTRRIEEMLKGQRRVRLSKPALEVLSVVAYRQPCTRVDVEEVRGVNSGGSIATLLERGLVRITGRSETLGRPLLYGTTDEFLSYMGINSIEDLPNLTEIEALLAVPKGDREDDTPIAAEERRLRLVEGMDSISELITAEEDDAEGARAAELTVVAGPEAERGEEEDDDVAAAASTPDGEKEAAADATSDPAPAADAMTAIESRVEEAEIARAEAELEQAIAGAGLPETDAPETDAAEPAIAEIVAAAATPVEGAESDAPRAAEADEEPLDENAEHIRLLQESMEREVADLTAAPDIAGELGLEEPAAEAETRRPAAADAEDEEGRDSAAALNREASA